MDSQKNKILELLQNQKWVCTSEMYAMFIADPRRRLCDLKDKGYILENRKCQTHNYHNGHSKEWRLMSALPDQLPESAQKGIDWTKENLFDAIGRPDLKKKFNESKQMILL